MAPRRSDAQSRSSILPRSCSSEQADPTVSKGSPTRPYQELSRESRSWTTAQPLSPAAARPDPEDLRGGREEGPGSLPPAARGTVRPNVTVRVVTALLLGTLLVIGCDPGGGQGSGSGNAPPARDEAEDVPLTGGACSYEELSFRATVDSVLGDGSLLVRADSVPSLLESCGDVGEVGQDRWRVPAAGGADSPARGDTVEIVGEVIVSGTCVPCAVATRRLPSGG